MRLKLRSRNVKLTPKKEGAGHEMEFFRLSAETVAGNEAITLFCLYGTSRRFSAVGRGRHVAVYARLSRRGLFCSV